MSDDLAMVKMCREMKWTIEEYLSQPEWFILGLNDIINAEAQHQKLAYNRQENEQWRMQH